MAAMLLGAAACSGGSVPNAMPQTVAQQVPHGYTAQCEPTPYARTTQIIKPQYLVCATPAPPIQPVTCMFDCNAGGDPSNPLCQKPYRYDASTDSCVIATVPGAAPAGATCSGSPDNNKIGENNLPANANTWGSTIANVYGFENNNGEIFGWVYVTENQSSWFQRNAADTGVGALLSFLQNIPGVSGIAQTVVNATTSPTQLSGQQWLNILQSMGTSGFKVHKCYAQGYTGGTVS